jgi:hypothetical protein
LFKAGHFPQIEQLLNAEKNPAKQMSMDEFKRKNASVLNYDKLDEEAQKKFREQLDKERDQKVFSKEKEGGRWC